MWSRNSDDSTMDSRNRTSIPCSESNSSIQETNSKDWERSPSTNNAILDRDWRDREERSSNNDRTNNRRTRSSHGSTCMESNTCLQYAIEACTERNYGSKSRGRVPSTYEPEELGVSQQNDYDKEQLMNGP